MKSSLQILNTAARVKTVTSTVCVGVAAAGFGLGDPIVGVVICCVNAGVKRAAASKRSNCH